MDAFRIAKDDVDQMAAYWMARKDELMGMTGDFFASLIDPAFAYEEEPDDLMSVQFNICYTEWLLFECKLLGGYTPLMAYVDQPPSYVDTDALDSLREVVRTQFFSRFAILEKRKRAGMATLRDVMDGRCYEVFDPHLCSIDGWKDGTIALRIARVDGVWQTVGQVCMYDRAPEAATRRDGPGCVCSIDGWKDGTIALRIARVDGVWQTVGQVCMYDRAPEAATRRDGPGCVHEEDRDTRPYLSEMGFFIRFVYDVFSIDGRYHHTMRLRQTDAGAALRREIEARRHGLDGPAG